MDLGEHTLLGETWRARNCGTQLRDRRSNLLSMQWSRPTHQSTAAGLHRLDMESQSCGSEQAYSVSVLPSTILRHSVEWRNWTSAKGDNSEKENFSVSASHYKGTLFEYCQKKTLEVATNRKRRCQPGFMAIASILATWVIYLYSSSELHSDQCCVLKRGH